MAYALVTDIEGEFKNIDFDTNTLVSTADVDRFIAQADALINSYVGMRYSVPITAGTDAVSLMQMYCTVLVADRIKKILEVKQTTNSAANQETRGAFGTREVLAGLLAIKNGDMKLDGATLLTSPGGFSSYNVANSIEPQFEKDTEQW
jgi:phage gp36-like protein